MNTNKERDKKGRERQRKEGEEKDLLLEHFQVYRLKHLNDLTRHKGLV
jgi:hypothetical protein